MTSDLIVDKDGDTWTRYQLGEYLAQWRTELLSVGMNIKDVDALTIKHEW